MATTSCRHPTINPCVCGRGPGSPSSWRRNGRWWGGRGRRRRFNSALGCFCVCVCVSKQPCFGLDRSEKQSLRRAWLKGMFQRWAGNIFMLFTRHYLRYRFELAACGSMDVSDALTCCICRYPERLKERQRQPARRPLRRSKLWVDLKHEYNSHFYWRLLDLASVCVKVVAWVLSYKPRRVLIVFVGAFVWFLRRRSESWRLWNFTKRKTGRWKSINMLVRRQKKRYRHEIILLFFVTNVVVSSS